MESISSSESDRLAASMNRSLVELERMVKGHEETLHKTIQRGAGRAQQPPSGLASFEIMATAYQEAAETPSPLPSRDSILPALMAMRRTRDTIVELRGFLAAQKAATENARRRLEVEEANLEDQRVLQKCLEDRIQELRDSLESDMELSPDQITKARLQELKVKKNNYDKEKTMLLKKLNKFIGEQLGPMLAAEELGGPVVGEMVDIDSDGLVAGFSSQGKLKKAPGGGNPAKRQQRIDEIWGSPSSRPAAKPRENWDESAAAASDMRELTEALMTSLLQAKGDHWAAYVKLPRESAAARFLVRSRIAIFHPKDATLLRLVDFGRDLDD